MRDQEKICREEWFPNHVANVLAGPPLDDAPVTIINWQKPGTWNYGCRFILHSNWLTVIGDLGEAVYQWSEKITPEFLAKLNLDYFAGKCRASEVGSKFVEFDARKIEGFKAGMTKDELEFVNEEITAGMGKSDVDQAISAAISGDRISFDFAESLLSWGIIHHPRCVGHWVGLKMALAQLGTTTQQIGGG